MYESSKIDVSIAACSKSGIGQPIPTVRLTTLQIEIISVFVNLMQVLGMPKSAGEIYGLLFASTTPISSEEISTTLEISSGSVSQGLRMLRSLGAVRTVYVPGDRRDHYLAETDLHKLAGGFLRENIEHHLLNGEERLSRLHQLVSHAGPTEDPAREFLGERVAMLKAWNQRARVVLPMVIQTLC